MFCDSIEKSICELLCCCLAECSPHFLTSFSLKFIYAVPLVVISLPIVWIRPAPSFPAMFPSKYLLFTVNYCCSDMAAVSSLSEWWHHIQGAMRLSRSKADSKVHGANIGPIRGWQDPGGPHVSPINFAIWDYFEFPTHSTVLSTIEFQELIIMYSMYYCFITLPQTRFEGSYYMPLYVLYILHHCYSKAILSSVLTT